jgi:hypothetical protein
MKESSKNNVVYFTNKMYMFLNPSWSGFENEMIEYSTRRK